VSKQRDDDPTLNPSLRSRTDTSHPTDGSDPAPADSASVQREEGRSWPWIWAVATIVGLVIVVWLVFL
jgi:hypothetical protein